MVACLSRHLVQFLYDESWILSGTVMFFLWKIVVRFCLEMVFYPYCAVCESCVGSCGSCLSLSSSLVCLSSVVVEVYPLSVRDVLVGVSTRRVEDWGVYGDRDS